MQLKQSMYNMTQLQHILDGTLHKVSFIIIILVLLLFLSPSYWFSN